MEDWLTAESESLRFLSLSLYLRSQSFIHPCLCLLDLVWSGLVSWKYFHILPKRTFTSNEQILPQWSEFIPTWQTKPTQNCLSWCPINLRTMFQFSVICDQQSLVKSQIKSSVGFKLWKSGLSSVFAQVNIYVPERIISFDDFFCGGPTGLKATSCFSSYITHTMSYHRISQW